jgi:hypothetical protein
VGVVIRAYKYVVDIGYGRSCERTNGGRENSGRIESPDFLKQVYFQSHYDSGVTQPFTEMSTRNLPGGKGRPAR